MDIDKELRSLWQSQSIPAVSIDELAARVRRHRRRLVLWRAGEAALTLFAVVALGKPLVDGEMTPVHWLLLPFFTVFLVVVWSVQLRRTERVPTTVSESVAVFARSRASQLRGSMRSLALTERSAWALLIYAAVAGSMAMLLGGGEWRIAGVWLLAWSALWCAGSRWWCARSRPRILAEYRRMRRLGRR